MRCTACRNCLPSNNYALVEGIYFCLQCFLNQYTGLPAIPIAEKTRETLTLPSSQKISNQKKETFGSTTSLNSIKSEKRPGSARRVSTAIANAFRRPQRSPSPAPTTPNASHQKPPHPSKTRHQTCQVCFDEKSSTYFRSMPTHKCLQDTRTICDTCVYSHIQQAFQEMCTDDVRCPELQCGIKFEYDTIKTILNSNKDEKLFERYDRFLFHHRVEQMDEFIWCSNPKCQMGQLNDGGELNNIVTCRRCHEKTCFTHKIKWHRGLTCEEYDSKTKDDLKASLKWLNQNTKTCPKCPYQIEKNDGCDHMTCIKCHYEFCWSCLASYDKIRKDGNHRHDPSCKHYAAYDEH